MITVLVTRSETSLAIAMESELLARIAGLERALHLETMARQRSEDRLHEFGAHMSSAASEEFEVIHCGEPALTPNRLNPGAAARARVVEP